MKISVMIPVGLACLLSVAVAEPLPALHPVQVRRFADHLFDTGRYDDALHEYRRLEYMGNGNSAVSYTAGLCHLNAGRYAEAAGHMQSLALESVDAGTGRLALNAYAYALYREGRYDSCLTVVDGNAFEGNPLRPVLRTVCLTRQQRWDEAGKAARVLAGDGISEKAVALCDDGAGVRRKSPLLASTLSLVPGLGNCYFGRYADGFYSFLVVAGSYASSYLAYRNESGIAMYGTAGFGAVMHLGNIFGSAVATRQRNRERLAAPAAALDKLFMEHGVYAAAGFRAERL